MPDRCKQNRARRTLLSFSVCSQLAASQSSPRLAEERGGFVLLLPIATVPFNTLLGSLLRGPSRPLHVTWPCVTCRVGSNSDVRYAAVKQVQAYLHVDTLMKA